MIPTATVVNGQLVLNQSVNWPDGTIVQLSPQQLVPVANRFTQDELDSIRAAWGEEPTEKQSTSASSSGSDDTEKYISDPKPTDEEFLRLLNAMASLDSGQCLPPDFSRADIYDDHD